MTISVEQAWTAFKADRYLDARRPEWAVPEAQGDVRFVRRDGMNVVLVRIDHSAIVSAFQRAAPPPRAGEDRPKARIRLSSRHWKPGWAPGLVPGALLWALGLLGFIAAVSGPLNVQVLVAAVLVAGRGFVLLMTSEVEGR
jgi:hypothetical protein